MSTPLQRVFRDLRAAGRKGVIPYITGGDPDLATTYELLVAMARGGATAIELGVPFSDPMADGPPIQLSDLRALRSGMTLRKTLAPPLRVRTWEEYNQTASAGFAMLKRVYALVLMLLIGVAAFNLIATLIMVVMEKRKDIAVLLAMGAKRRDVWRIFVLKGLVVGAAGTAAGLLLGATACFALERYHFIRIPREIYGISTVPVTVEPSNFVLVALASLGLCLIATFYPARRASREMPVEVFRS